MLCCSSSVAKKGLSNILLQVLKGPHTFIYPLSMQLQPAFKVRKYVYLQMG